MKRKRNEECKENQITTINLFGFTFYLKIMLCSKALFKISSLYRKLYITFYLQFLYVAGYLKRSNDTPEL